VCGKAFSENAAAAADSGWRRAELNETVGLNYIFSLIDFIIIQKPRGQVNRNMGAFLALSRAFPEFKKRRPPLPF